LAVDQTRNSEAQHLTSIIEITFPIVGTLGLKKVKEAKLRHSISHPDFSRDGNIINTF